MAGLLSYLRTRDHELPLGPFLSLGAVLVMLWGNQIVHFWVVELMGWSRAPVIITYGS